MSLTTPELESPPGQPLSYASIALQDELLEELERLVKSSHFRNSKRYPAVLKFIVSETLEGRGSLLKERTIGVEVFGRPADYDTNADPIVRITVGEVRKRIAQYYQSLEHDGEWKVVLPLGTYMPHFVHPFKGPILIEGSAVGIHPEPIAERVIGNSKSHEVESHPAIPASSRFSGSHVFTRIRLPAVRVHIKLVSAGALLAVMLLGAFEFFRWHRASAQESPLWTAVLESPAPAVIVVGVHSLGSDGSDQSPATSIAAGSSPDATMLSSMTTSNMVSFGCLLSHSLAVEELTRHHHAYRTLSAAQTRFNDLQRGPVVLIGALNNPWTLRLTSTLPFYFRYEEGGLSEIVDREHPDRRWRFDSRQRALANSHDFAVVAAYYDPQIEQPVLLLGGLGMNGTATAASFATDSQYQDGKNVAVLLSTDVVEGSFGPAHILTVRTW